MNFRLPTLHLGTDFDRAPAALPVLGTASRGDSAHVAPVARIASALPRVRVCTVTACPAASRCPAIGSPMIPIPINATRFVIPAILKQYTR